MDHTSTVADHYNRLQESGLEERTKCRIFYQRNFHNWIKSLAIGKVLDWIRENKHSGGISVLDLCAGKGGDLLKWKKGRIDTLICADIAGTSVEQCEARYKDLAARSQNERYPEKVFTAEFITADCSKKRLRDMYKDPSIEFDLCSCQFSFHYCFESLPQAEVMLANACENLKPGGYFVGTTPNSLELVRRLRESESLSFGSEVYRVSFEEGTDKYNLPLFGAKYNFDLDESVHCPEFLVYFPLLEKMAEKHNMKLVYKKTFADFVADHSHLPQNHDLAKRMQAFEMYPPEDGVELMCKDSEAYASVEQFVHEKKQKMSEASNGAPPRNVNVGTLSKPEWEASTLYLVFIFQRQYSDQQGSNEDTKSDDQQSSRKRKLDTDNTCSRDDVNVKSAKS